MADSWEVPDQLTVSINKAKYARMTAAFVGVIMVTILIVATFYVMTWFSVRPSAIEEEDKRRMAQ